MLLRNVWIKRSAGLLLVSAVLTGYGFGRLKPGALLHDVNRAPLAKITAETPPSTMISWVGAGYLTKYTISNTGQNGLFEAPPGWTGYDGMWPTGYGLYNGRTAEFPRGTNQFYVWGAGLWIGAKSPNFNTPDDKPVIIEYKGGTRTFSNVRVAAAAYYSDQSTVARLWQSNQTINGQTDGKSPTNEGQFLFGQKNKNIEEYQDVWAFFAPRVGDVYGYTEQDTIYRLDYEEINAKRRQVLAENSSLDPGLILLNPFRKDQAGNVVGDIVSDEDTYTVFGDYINDRYADFLWTTGYDVRPLGVRVEQRTYSWSIDDYLYINYKIKNMNSFPLDSVFIGYFMDNDIGFADDDLIGFDKQLNLGYSYDFDLMETGWQTSAGYIGSIFVETPKDTIDGELKQIGLTGFQTWIRSDLGVSEGFPGDVDDDATDHLKYAELALVDSFEVYENPQDVRQLTSSGPVKRLNPGEEISVTLAIVGGASLAELKSNTRAAVQKYNSGFIGPEPPSSPGLTVIPGHHRAYLSWTSDPLDDIDPYTGQQDFEGFRVYKSTSGLQDSWELLADYDVLGDSTNNSATVEYTRGSSNATVRLAGLLPEGDLQAIESGTQTDEKLLELFYERFKEAEYTIELVKTSYTPDNINYYDTTRVVIYDVTNRQLVPFNFFAITYGYGFTLYKTFNGNRSTNKAQDDIYRSGYYIYFNGVLIQISNGQYEDKDQDGEGNGVRDRGEPFTDSNGNGIWDSGEPFVDVEDEEKALQKLKPAVGDIFTVKTYLTKDIGNQTDLAYTYVDAELTDGMTYYYAVTSYDKGYPDLNIPSLESSYYQNIQSVIPQHQPLEVIGEPELTGVEHVGESTGRIARGILDHRNLKGHAYEIRFYKEDPNSSKLGADYGILWDRDLEPVAIYGEELGNGNDASAIRLRVAEMDVYPGTLILQIEGETGTVTDDSLGNLQGQINGGAVRGVIHYGKGVINLERDQNTFLSTNKILADYQYSKLRVMDWGPDTLTGTVKYNPRIYAAKELAADSTLIDHGFLFRVDSPQLSVDSVAWGVTSDQGALFRTEINPGQVEPYDYFITFPDTGAATAMVDYASFAKPNQRVPWKAWNRTLGVTSRMFNPNGAFIIDGLIDWRIEQSAPYDSLNINTARILTEATREAKAINPFAFEVVFVPIDTNLATADYLDIPSEDDTLYIFTSRPITTEDIFRFGTSNMNTPVEKVDMNQIKVVPNPYYVRAIWDTDRYTQHIDFRHMPLGTIDNPVHVRIFNVAGNMVAHLRKNGIVEANEVLDQYGTLSWDLRNYEGLKVASGLYLYYVEAKINGETLTHTGKIAVILGP